jgi:hypothetical protein
VTWACRLYSTSTNKVKLIGEKDVVILAARSQDLGLQAVQDLNQQGKTDW